MAEKAVLICFWHKVLNYIVIWQNELETNTQQNPNGSRQKLMRNLSIENNQYAHIGHLRHICFAFIHLLVFLVLGSSKLGSRSLVSKRTRSTGRAEWEGSIVDTGGWQGRSEEFVLCSKLNEKGWVGLEKKVLWSNFFVCFKITPLLCIGVWGTEVAVGELLGSSGRSPAERDHGLPPRWQQWEWKNKRQY